MKRFQVNEDLSVCRPADLLVLGHNLQMLRLIKSKAEIELMRKSGSIASRAIAKVCWRGNSQSHLS